MVGVILPSNFPQKSENPLNIRLRGDFKTSLVLAVTSVVFPLNSETFECVAAQKCLNLESLGVRKLLVLSVLASKSKLQLLSVSSPTCQITITLVLKFRRRLVNLLCVHVLSTFCLNALNDHVRSAAATILQWGPGGVVLFRNRTTNPLYPLDGGEKVDGICSLDL